MELYGTGHVVNAMKSRSTEIIGDMSVDVNVVRDGVSNVATGNAASEVNLTIHGAYPTDLSTANVADGSRWFGATSSRAFGIRRNGGWTWL